MLTNLRAIRESRGYTQADVARVCGVTPPAVAHWESGLASPNVARMVKLAALLRVSTDELTTTERTLDRAA